MTLKPLLDAIDRVDALTEDQVAVDYAKVKSAVESPDGRFVALYGPQAQPTVEEEPASRNSLLEEIELSHLRAAEEDA